jgi:hypothetical protein
MTTQARHVSVTTCPMRVVAVAVASDVRVVIAPDYVGR